MMPFGNELRDKAADNDIKGTARSHCLDSVCTRPLTGTASHRL